MVGGEHRLTVPGRIWQSRKHKDTKKPISDTVRSLLNAVIPFTRGNASTHCRNRSCYVVVVVSVLHPHSEERPTLYVQALLEDAIFFNTRIKVRAHEEFSLWSRIICAYAAPCRAKY